MVDEADGGERRPQPLVDDLDHLEVAVAPPDAHGHTVADDDGRGRLGWLTVEPDVPGAARLGCRRSRRVDADGPEPSVDPCDVHQGIVARSDPSGRAHPLRGGWDARPPAARAAPDVGDAVDAVEVAEVAKASRRAGGSRVVRRAMQGSGRPGPSGGAQARAAAHGGAFAGACVALAAGVLASGAALVPAAAAATRAAAGSPSRSYSQVTTLKAVPGIRLAAIDGVGTGSSPYRVHVPFAQLTGRLTGAERRIDVTLAAAARADVAKFERQVRADVLPASLTGARRLSTLDGVVTSDLVSSRYVSLTMTTETVMAGAAHGFATVTTTNDSLATGRAVPLARLFRPGARWLAMLSARSRHVLRRELGRVTTPQMLDPGTAPVASNFAAWALTPFGLSLTFQNYQVAAYVAGSPTLTIPYADLAGVGRRGGPLSQVAADPPRRMTLLPAVSPPVVGECSQPVHDVDFAVPVPSRCASGAVNVVAWDDLVAVGLRVMALPAHVTVGEVRRAMCSDTTTSYEGSDLLEEHAEALVGRYHGWRFGTAALEGFPAYCHRPATT